MWLTTEECSGAHTLLPGKIITSMPGNPDEEFEILSIEDGTVIAYHCNGKNRLLAMSFASLVEEKWWMKL